MYKALWNTPSPSRAFLSSLELSWAFIKLIWAHSFKHKNRFWHGPRTSPPTSPDTSRIASCPILTHSGLSCQGSSCQGDAITHGSRLQRIFAFGMSWADLNPKSASKSCPHKWIENGTWKLTQIYESLGKWIRLYKQNKKQDHKTLKWKCMQTLDSQSS